MFLILPVVNDFPNIILSSLLHLYSPAWRTLSCTAEEVKPQACYTGERKTTGSQICKRVDLTFPGPLIWKSFSWFWFQAVWNQIIRRFIGIIYISDELDTWSAWVYFPLHVTSNGYFHQSICALLAMALLCRSMSDNRRCVTMRNATGSPCESEQDTVAGEMLERIGRATKEIQESSPNLSSKWWCRLSDGISKQQHVWV